MSIIGFTTLLISPDRIQYIRKIRAKVRFGGMFIFFGGGDWILQHRHWPPTNSRKHVYILHIINGWPTFNHPKEWQPQKEQNNKGCSLQKGTSTKKDHPPSTPVLLHFQGRLAIHRDVLKQCFLPFKGHLQFRLHVLFLAGQDMSCKSWSKHKNLWAHHGDQTSRLKEPQSVARAARPFHWLWAALLHLYLGM